MAVIDQIGTDEFTEVLVAIGQIPQDKVDEVKRELGLTIRSKLHELGLPDCLLDIGESDELFEGGEEEDDMAMPLSEL